MADKGETHRPILVIDIETTGFSADYCAVIEFGACLVVGEQLHRTVGMLVRPKGRRALETPGAKRAQRVHGIEPGQVWEHGMTVKRAAHRVDQYLARIEQRFGVRPVLAAWGAAFEQRFLERSPWGMDEWYCLLAEARGVLPDAASHSLPVLAAELGIDTGASHRAQDDARTAALVMLHLRRARSPER